MIDILLPPFKPSIPTGTRPKSREKRREIPIVTIREIAKISGVSKSTVSRVLNNDRYVSSELRKKVQTVIEDTKYVVNGNAVKLSKGETFTLGVTLPYNSSCYSQLVDSILYQAKSKGYQVLLLPTYYEEETESNYYTLLEQKMIDGLILTSRTKNDHLLEPLRFKGKIVSTEKMDNEELTMIYPDRKKAYDQLFSTLHTRGISKVMFTTKRSADQSQTTKNKLAAYEAYFGKAIEGEHYFTTIENYEDGRALAAEISARSSIPEVIYVNGDDTAAGVIFGMKQAGFIHKKDFTIIGEGNLPYSEILAFSTIDFAPQKIGASAVDFLLSESERLVQPEEPTIIWR
nr:LacI family DNA-binding transcriptional regulator [Enterococcus sp. DIV1298c]